MKSVLLIDIGAGPLPAVTPVPVRQSAWFPVLHAAPPLPTPANVRTTAVADGILVEWDAVPIEGVVYVVWRAPAEAGPFVIVYRTMDLRYLHTDNTGEPSWFRVSIELNGRESEPSVPVEDVPVAVTDQIAEADRIARDAAVAALAAEKAAADEAVARARDIAGVSGAIEYDPEVETPAGTVVRTDTGIYRATQVVPVETPPPNGTYWHALGTVAGLADGQAGQATSIFDLQATSEDLGYQQSLMAGALQDVQAELPGKASTQSVSLLQTEVTQIGDEVEANSTAIQQQGVTIGQQSASITQIAQVAAKATISNGVSNPSFEQGSAGWGANINGTGPLPAGCAVYTSAPTARSGNNYLAFVASAGAAYSESLTPVLPGQPVRVGFWSRIGSVAAVPNSWIRLVVRCYDAAGVQLTFAGTNAGRVPVADTVYRLSSADFLPPAGTTHVRVGIQNNASTGNWLVDDVFCEPQSPATAELMASVTMVIDVNGRFVGYRITNDGTTGSIVNLADSWSVVDASGNGSTEYVGGRWISRSGGFMTVSGKPFGQNNEMIEWYGPSFADLASCRRNNAIYFKTNTGIFYAKGAVFSGTITAGGQTLSLIATTYTTGPFGTNGGPIAVNASFSHFRKQMAGRLGTTKNTMSAGSGTTTATIQLWRRIGAGAWSMVASQNITGTMVIVTDPDPEIESFADWNLTGSISYTDNVGGTAVREYEIRLSAASFQNVNISGPGAVPPPTNERALGVLTAE